jgi:hypothetical protein
MGKGVHTQYHLECILDGLVTLCCFRLSLLIGYALKVRMEWVITLKLHQILLDRNVDPSSSFGQQLPHFHGTTISFVSPCQLIILTSWMIFINPYDSSNHYHPWR